jgi:DNA-binding NarL/FixJ family response regulator
VTGILDAGANGYLLKESAFEELVFCIRSVTKNQVYLSPSIAGDIVKDYSRRVSESKSGHALVLTPREREVLQLMAEGSTTKEIAGRLGVSVKTIETYRKRIMDRLDLHSVAELTKYAIREGITSLDY